MEADNEHSQTRIEGGRTVPEQLAFNMDCLEAMRGMPDKAFDLAVVDPPYGINITKADRIFGSSRSVKVEREREKRNRRQWRIRWKEKRK